MTMYSSRSRWKAHSWLPRAEQVPSSFDDGKISVSIFVRAMGKVWNLLLHFCSFYEGYSIRDITFPIRVLKLLGIHTLIGNGHLSGYGPIIERSIECSVVTNAAGGLNPEYSAGDIVVLHDVWLLYKSLAMSLTTMQHLNLAGLAGIHPLRGPNVEFFGTRFPPLSDAYDLNLRIQAFQAWEALDITNKSRRFHEGIYAFVGGPRYLITLPFLTGNKALIAYSYETRAECRMLRSLGADLVGMSTVPEIIVARHSGIRVLALSLVTNKAVMDVGPKGNEAYGHQLNLESLMELIDKEKADHEEVLQVGHQAGSDMKVCMTLLS